MNGSAATLPKYLPGWYDVMSQPLIFEIETPKILTENCNYMYFVQEMAENS